MGDLVTALAALLGIIAIESALDARPVVIHRITISEAIKSHWGFTEESIEQKLKDEAYLVIKEAASRKETARVSTPNADGSIDNVARSVGLLRLLERLQQIFGVLEYSVTGDLYAERGRAVLELRVRRFDHQVIRARAERPMDQLDQLMRDGGWALVGLVDPHDACAAVLRYSIAMQQPRPEAAIACANIALTAASSQDRPWLYNLRGVSQTMLGQRWDAFNSFREALSLQRAFAPAWLNIGILMAAEGRYEDAVKAFGEALRAHRRPQTRAAVLAVWAITLERQGRRDEVIAKLREAFRADMTYDLPVRLLLERLPEDSIEAGEIRKIAAEMGVRSGAFDWVAAFTDHLVGVMPMSVLFPARQAP